MKRILLIVTAFLFTACSDDLTGPTALLSTGQSADQAATSLTVMTRNMYVGTDVDRVIETPDPNQIPFVVGEVWQLLLANDYSQRAAAMAREIAANRPHVVGLQEVSLFRTQTPADFQLNAQEVVIDFIPTLLAELSALGETYVLVAQIEDTDVELPRLNPDFSLTDVRLTDYDAIIARSDVEVSNVSSANYAASVPGPMGLTILRGWVAADVTVGDQTYRVLNTHLEPVETADGYFQGLQAVELIDLLAGEIRPTVLLGDLNTEAPSGDTYVDLIADGFMDAWDLRAGLLDTGFTCCHDNDLSSDAGVFHKRIDHVLVRNFEDLWSRAGANPVRAEIVGDEPGDKTPSGLWPSDHGGMVVRMQLPRPGP
ncbi:MAG: endonuclease/exonuclease/phosphatase family protein [Gemmatimonadota bacterium]|nr:endonuclease/exonuclease/phosphatase family protein [Gemmatimonadota bacterium]